MQLKYRYTEHMEEDGTHLHVNKFKIVKKTPCDAWVIGIYKSFNGEWNEYGKKRLVLDGNGKRYCYDTLELAMQSFLKRKKYQAKCCRNSLEIAEYIISKQNDINNLTEDDFVIEAEHITSRYIFE